MKRNYAYLKAVVLSCTLIFGLEYTLILITGDYQLCFWHNTVVGNILAWSVRVIALLVFTSIFSSLFLPVYKTLRDRMLEKEEQKSNHKIGSELILEQYLLKQAK